MHLFDKTPFYFYHKLINCPRYLKAAFASSFVFGCLSHMYIMTHLLPNGDGCSALFGYGAGYTSGRWGLALLGEFIRIIFGNYSLPWLNGILSILFLSISSILIIKAFDIQNDLNCIFISAIMVTFPSITSTFIYIFTTPYYCFSILLTCLAAYLVRKYSKGWIAGIFLLTCSLGIYQAYLGIAAGMFLLFLIVDTLHPKYNIKKTFVCAWGYLGILVTSVAFYFVFNKIALIITNNNLSEYMGINSMGQIPLNQLPQIISRIYIEFLAPAIVERYGINQYPIIRVSYFIFLLFTIFFSVRIIYLSWNNKGYKSACLTTFFLILFPFAINIIYIMCLFWVHTLMRYSVVIFYIAFIIIWEKQKNLFFSYKLISLMEWMIVCLFTITIGSFCIQANESYLCLYQNHMQTYSYYNTIITQIKMTKEYTANTPIAFIGETKDPTFPNISEFDNLKNLCGIMNGFDYVNMYSRDKFMRYFCGFAPPLATNLDMIKSSLEFQDMSVYPNQGSIKIINGTLIVKFED